MTDDETMAPGEIRRGFARIEKQLDSMQLTMNTVLGPVGELRVSLSNTVKDVDELAGKVRAIEKALNSIEIRSAAVAGGATAIVFFVKFLLGH